MTKLPTNGWRCLLASTVWEVKGQKEGVSLCLPGWQKTLRFYPVMLVNLERIGYRELPLTSQKRPTNPSQVFFCDTTRKGLPFISLSLMLSSHSERSADRKGSPLQAVLLFCQPSAQRAFPLLPCLVRPLEILVGEVVIAGPGGSHVSS